MAEIVVVGEALMDFFAEPGMSLSTTMSFSPRCGGAPANVAVAAAQAGGDVAFVGRVGDDAFGHLLRERIAEKGVDVSNLLADATRPTMMAFVALPTPDSPEFTLLAGANENLTADDIPNLLLATAKILAFGSVTLAYESRAAVLDAIRRARAFGANVLFDVNYRPNIWPSKERAVSLSWEAIKNSNVIKMNADEAALLFPGATPDTAARALVRDGADLVCLTLGAGGCTLFGVEAEAHCDAFEVGTVDATGSGDAFVAGASVALCKIGKPVRNLDAGDLRRVGNFANACGAIAATQTGAMEASLDPAGIQRLLDGRMS